MQLCLSSLRDIVQSHLIFINRWLEPKFKINFQTETLQLGTALLARMQNHVLLIKMTVIYLAKDR